MAENIIPHQDNSLVMDRLYDCAAMVQAAAEMLELLEQDDRAFKDEAALTGRLGYIQRVLRQAHDGIVDRVNELDIMSTKQAA